MSAQLTSHGYQHYDYDTSGLEIITPGYNLTTDVVPGDIGAYRRQIPVANDTPLLLANLQPNSGIHLPGPFDLVYPLFGETERPDWFSILLDITEDLNRFIEMTSGNGDKRYEEARPVLAAPPNSTQSSGSAFEAPNEKPEITTMGFDSQGPSPIAERMSSGSLTGLASCEPVERPIWVSLSHWHPQPFDEAKPWSIQFDDELCLECLHEMGIGEKAFAHSSPDNRMKILIAMEAKGRTDFSTWSDDRYSDVFDC
ncbi:hypothetical protein BJ508DRAFT_313008 [Ascobolus immersus RN42]|uniref:Uncharacterized protein n=1 Tax=Ascobolus immersus RN42 TaxID=1160509 RepID=A0A3N4HKC7_ASCIM|nr:hypothetical protein BJ508DRAFT_313008 [Ascobolus immersus RN42]